jgi:hypothetical protein
LAQSGHAIDRFEPDAMGGRRFGADFEMRKIALLALACTTLATVAPPVLAQPAGPPHVHDRRGPDRDFERWRGDFQRQLSDLQARVTQDFRRGILSKKVTKAFDKRIQELQHAERRAREKNGGYLRPDQRRDMDAAIDRVRSDLRLNEERVGRGRR